MSNSWSAPTRSRASRTLLALALRQHAGLAPTCGSQAACLHQPVGPPVVLGLVRMPPRLEGTVASGEHRIVGGDRRPEVPDERLARKGHPAAHHTRVAPTETLPQHLDRSPGRHDAHAGHLQESCLAGPVGAEKDPAPPRLHVQVDRVQGPCAVTDHVDTSQPHCDKVRGTVGYRHQTGCPEGEVGGGGRAQRRANRRATRPASPAT